jgi:TrmH family RNA methyltransferase
MISKNKIKELKKLHVKKHRNSSKYFIVEGEKIVSELLEERFQNSSFRYQVHAIYGITDWLEQLPPYLINGVDVVEDVEYQQLKQITTLQNPNNVLAVVEMPEISEMNGVIDNVNTGFSLVLDNIQDPGNLGTIIRTADWFGVDVIFCSPDTVDMYNPKVIQSAMGSVFRVNVVYCDLQRLLNDIKKISGAIIYGAFLKGKSIYDTHLKQHNGYVVLGNESKGIKKALVSLVDEPLLIPKFNSGSFSAESLNISIATGIVCSEFKRRGE